MEQIKCNVCVKYELLYEVGNARNQRKQIYDVIFAGSSLTRFKKYRPANK